MAEKQPTGAWKEEQRLRGSFRQDLQVSAAELLRRKIIKNEIMGIDAAVLGNDCAKVPPQLDSESRKACDKAVLSFLAAGKAKRRQCGGSRDLVRFHKCKMNLVWRTVKIAKKADFNRINGWGWGIQACLFRRSECGELNKDVLSHHHNLPGEFQQLVQNQSRVWKRWQIFHYF